MGILQAISMGRNAGTFYGEQGKSYPDLRGYSDAYRNAFAAAYIIATNNRLDNEEAA